MTDLLFSPALIMIVSGLIMLAGQRHVRDLLTVIAPLLTLIYIWMIDDGQFAAHHFMGYELLTVFVHPYTHIFATVFTIAALGGGIFAMNANRGKELGSAFIYAGGAIGVTFAGDFLTFFIYWELMAIASTAVIWCAGTEQAKAAGLRYAIMHFLGGVLLMAGIAAHVGATQVIMLPEFNLIADKWLWTSTLYSTDLDASSIGVWLIFAGILVNVAAPPFSSWLSDAYPESTATGMVFLSAFTTKTAVFALLTLFAGVELLIYIGAFMIFYGIIMAILENDMRRILAFSIINQVGFMVTGIGIGTTLAMNGAAAHAFCHIIYKALLLMSAGSVLHMTGRRKCSELGGLFRTMPVTCVCGIIGAMAISAFPLTSGFVSKSLISSAAAEEHLVWVWYALAAASAGVFLHAGIKFPWFVFFQKDSGLRPVDPPVNMRFAMLLFSGLCIIPGILPDHLLYFMLPDVVEYDANTYAHVVNQLQLLLFAGLAFFLCLPLLKRTPTITLDWDWLYRHLGTTIWIWLEKRVMEGYKSLIVALQHALFAFAGRIKRLTGPGGVLAETKPLANTTLIVAILLAGYLLFYLNART